MRVRISYSVDLDDVPSECARMLHDSIEHVEELREEISELTTAKRKLGWLKTSYTDVEKN